MYRADPRPKQAELVCAGGGKEALVQGLEDVPVTLYWLVLRHMAFKKSPFCLEAFLFRGVAIGWLSICL